MSCGCAELASECDLSLLIWDDGSEDLIYILVINSQIVFPFCRFFLKIVFSKYSISINSK